MKGNGRKKKKKKEHSHQKAADGQGKLERRGEKAVERDGSIGRDKRNQKSEQEERGKKKGKKW